MEKKKMTLEDILNQSTGQVRKQTAQDLVNDVPDLIRKIMPNSAGEFKDVNEANESLKLIANGITFQKEEYTKNIDDNMIISIAEGIKNNKEMKGKFVRRRRTQGKK